MKNVYNLLCERLSFIDFYWFWNFSMHKKRLLEGDVNTPKQVGVVYEVGITVNMLCVCRWPS